MDSSRTLKKVLSLVAGLLVGSFVAGVLAGFVAYVVAKRTEREVRKGWNLLGVMVAARPLTPGEKLPLEALAQRSVPEQLVTESVVTTEMVRFVEGQMITAPLSAGDPLYWGLFASSKPGSTVLGPRSLGDPAVWEACHAALVASPTLPKPDRTPTDIRNRLVPQGGQ